MARRGTIAKRGENTWRIAVPLEPDPVTGERRRRFETFHGTKKEAEKRLTELLTQSDRGLLRADPKVTLGAFLERWLKDYASVRAPKTYAYYEQVIRTYIVPHLGAVKLDKLKPSHAVRLQTILRETDRKDGKGRLSAQTVKHAHRVLHAALECAVQWQVLPRNPLDSVKAPPVTRSEMRAFTVEQARSFLEASAAEGPKWQAFFTTAMTTGLRIGELKGLRWQDLDLGNGTLRVQQSIQRLSGAGLVTKSPKNSGSRRPVAIDDGLVALLRRHRTEQNEERLRLGPLWQDRDLIFPSHTGGPLEDSTLHQVFTRVCERASVPRIRPYDLRHSCASLLLAAGVHPKVVAERLGHSTVNLTLSTYSHVLPTLQKDAAETLGRLLKRGSP